MSDLPSTSGFGLLKSRKARIQVDESFGGLAPAARELDVYTGSGGGDCGFPFAPGEKYLVAASVGDDGLLHAGICGFTRRLDAARPLLHVLRKERDGQPVPSLIGTIAQTDRNFQGPLGTGAPQPLPNTLVRVKANRQSFETRSSADGLFEFYNLPSGKYDFAPELPPGTTLSWFMDSDRPATPFELHQNSCQLQNIEVFAGGSIQGRVIDMSNQPLPQAFVYIVPVSQKILPGGRQLYWVFQDQKKGGFFKFVHIPPGDYQILINPDDLRSADFPYARTFYPNAHERESAKVITLQGGEQIQGADIHVEQQFVARNLTVRVTWADGRLIRDDVFVDAKPENNPVALAHTKQANRKSSILQLSLVPDESYEIKAHLICQYATANNVGPGQTLESNAADFRSNDDRTEVSLIIPAMACPDIPGKTTLTEKR